MDSKPKQDNRAAQAIVELAVFGSIFLFIIGSVFQQGYAASSYQQSQLQSMRRALQSSYLTGIANTNPEKIGNGRRNSASFLLIEDRLSPGFAKYGAVDRQPVIASGSGTLSTQLYKIEDWSDYAGWASGGASDIPVMDLQVNGQQFELSMAGAYWLRMQYHKNSGNMVLSMFTSQPPFDANGGLCAVGEVDPDKKSWERVQRETLEACPSNSSVPCVPYCYIAAARGSENFKGAVEADPPEAKDDWMYDYGRNGIGSYKDALWTTGSSSGLAKYRKDQALWKWVGKYFKDVQADVAKAIKNDDGSYPSCDVNGNLGEETIFAMKTSDATCAGEDYRVYDMAVLDSDAGDYDSSDVVMLGDPRLVNGVKPDASIYTQLSDGTVFEVRRGAWYVPGTNQLAMSANKKSQTDVISRVFQLNQRMAFPESFAWRQQWAALQRGENNSPVEVSCHNNADLSQTTPPGYGGCCMDAANLLKTCFDENSRTLFLRSRITDQRGHWWTSAVDTGAEQRLMQKKQ